MTGALIGFGVLFALTFFGVPLVASLLAVGFGGFAMYRGFEAAEAVVGQQFFDAMSSYGFSVIPLFVLMGAFIQRGGLADDLFALARACLGHFRGGIAHATIGASGAFAAVCGSSVAAAATMSRVAIPQLKRYDYEVGFAGGTVAAGGTLGILIPPSVPLVIFGILTETDIAALFMAGILPGILLALLYMLTAWLMVFLRPGLGMRADRLRWIDRLEPFKKTLPIGGLFLLVLGGIYWGFFTPTEAGAVGAAGAFALMAMRGKANFKTIVDALSDAVLTTTAILVTMSASLVFNNFLTITGLTGQLIDWVQSYAAIPVMVILTICVIYIVLGAVFDSLAAMILTVPVLTPLVASLGYDPIWFGILVVVAVELGLITPPMGMNVFIVQRYTPGVSIWTLFRGVTPYVFANLLLLGLLVVAPWLALLIPNGGF